MTGDLEPDPFRHGRPAEEQREIGIDELQAFGARVGQGIRQIGGERGADYRRRLLARDELPSIAGPESRGLRGPKYAPGQPPKLPSAEPGRITM